VGVVADVVYFVLLVFLLLLIFRLIMEYVFLLAGPTARPGWWPPRSSSRTP
jgi:hypothetical protein